MANSAFTPGAAGAQGATGATGPAGATGATGPGGVAVGGNWAAGSYSNGAIVKRDNVWWLANTGTSDPPGSVIPPFRRDNYDLYSRARWTDNGRVRLTDGTSQNGSCQAKTARTMQALDLYLALAIPGADQLTIAFADSTDGSYVNNDYDFSANIGVAIRMDIFNSNVKILQRTVHSASATVIASAVHGWDRTIAQMRLVIAVNGGNWDVTVYDWTTSTVTTTALAFPASVRPLFGAWCGGTGGNWDVETFDDASQSSAWVPLNGRATP